MRAAVVLAVLAATGTAAAQPLPDGATAPTEDDRADAAAYHALVRRGPPHVWRALLEELAFVGGGAIWYWVDRERQVADWDFPSIEQRLTFESWRFDNNPFPINFAWHMVDGTAYHLAARENDFSLLASVGVGLATSLAWEIGLEFREKTSVNDVIVTTGAGTAFGEYFHWMGRYFESAPDPRWWHPLARWGLSTGRAAHNALDGRDGLREHTEADALGFSSDIWHRFTVSSGYVGARLAGDAAAGPGADTLSLGTLDVAGELAAIPGYRRGRVGRRFFRDGNVTRARLRLTGGADAIGLDLAADTLLLGWHVEEPASSTTVGVSLAYRYQRELFGDWVDRLAQMHLPGLGVDEHVRWAGGDLHARARLHADFAGLHAAAYPEWKAGHVDAVEKTILQKHGYYYGWGVSAQLEVDVRLGWVEVGGAARWARYGSQEGLDRTQEEVMVDVAASDRVLELDGFLRVAPRGRLFVEARVNALGRDGSVGDVTSSQDLRRVTLAIGAAL